MINNKCAIVLTMHGFLSMSLISIFDVRDNSKFEYLLYENFEKTKALKIEEQKNVKKLNIFRFKIDQIHNRMKRMLDHVNILSNRKTIIQI